jgi:hypothetical protein
MRDRHNVQDEVGIGRVSHTETCLFWRCARHVLNEGHPASDNVVVCVPGRKGGQFPVLIMTLTKAGRLICWPVLLDGVRAPEKEHKLHLIAHVTLELQSKRCHSSAYSPKSGKLATAHRWRLHAFPDNSVSFWFGFAVRFSVIEDQALERHQRFRCPGPDAQRRKDEYVRLFERLRFVDTNYPTDCGLRGDALCGLVYVVDGPKVTLSHELLQPFSQLPDEFWDAAAEQQIFNFKSTGFAVGSAQLGLLLGVPPRGLREDGPFIATPRHGRVGPCSTH